MRILILVLIALALPAAAQSTLYTYVDNHGLRHYTNVPSDARARAIKLPKHQSVQSRPRVRLSHIPKQHQHHGMHGLMNTSRLENHILHASMEHQVDPLLIKAIIKTESNFNQFAVSSHGAQGLMQLMPETARDLQVTDPFDAYQNISAGTRYFRNLLDTFSGNIRLSLAAYNAGPGRVARLGAIPRIPETIDYVRTVLRHYQEYKHTTSRLSTSINLRRLVTIN
ncbi:MAG TPA: DUF4124 domain-containing protein [Desulfobulbaceae bacterium]|nr:DUF4124 domain-containing protein [Desulfobulbaceae bacterium]